MNYVREGDGLPHRSGLFGSRSEGIGTTRELRGLFMREINDLEREIVPGSQEMVRYYRELEQATSKEQSNNTGINLSWQLFKAWFWSHNKYKRLAVIYYLNHSLRSYYRPEFSRPIKEIVPPSLFH